MNRRPVRNIRLTAIPGKRIAFAILVIACVALVWLLPIVQPQNALRSGAGEITVHARAAERNETTHNAALVGDNLLGDYAKPSLPPENDLVLLSRLMNNFTLLVKSAANRPLSANEDWAQALRGQNPARERFISDQHICLNRQGQLIDRWGTPLFFHALGGGSFQIRSAGPDRRLWTQDDVQLNPDGSLHRGPDLGVWSQVH